mgnify:CR=1 FL=1
MIRAYRFRIYPTAVQVQKLEQWFPLCCMLYNACLQQRKDAWRMLKRSDITKFSQTKELPGLRKECPEFAAVPAQVLQNVCGRVERAISLFFLRRSRGETAGYPRFRPRTRYTSVTFPHLEPRAVADDGVRLYKLGKVKWKAWKTGAARGKAKNVTVMRTAVGWYATVTCEVPDQPPLPRTGKVVGVDLGVTNLVVTSDGVVHGSIAGLKVRERALARVQSAYDRSHDGSGRKNTRRLQLAKHHARLAAARKAQLDVLSRQLIDQYDVIGIEDLDVEEMQRKRRRNDKLVGIRGRGLRRNLKHASHGALIRILTYKAEEAGRELIKVDPRGTSQECSTCGEVVRKTLRDRRHHCPHCGLDLDRDHNAAINVLKRALSARRGEAELTRLDELQSCDTADMVKGNGFFAEVT